MRLLFILLLAASRGILPAVARLRPTIRAPRDPPEEPPATAEDARSAPSDVEDPARPLIDSLRVISPSFTGPLLRTTRSPASRACGNFRPKRRTLLLALCAAAAGGTMLHLHQGGSTSSSRREDGDHVLHPYHAAASTSSAIPFADASIPSTPSAPPFPVSTSPPYLSPHHEVDPASLATSAAALDDPSAAGSSALRKPPARQLPPRRAAPAESTSTSPSTPPEQLYPTAKKPRLAGEGILDALDGANRDPGEYLGLMFQRAYPKEQIASFFSKMARRSLLPADADKLLYHAAEEKWAEGGATEGGLAEGWGEGRARGSRGSSRRQASLLVRGNRETSEENRGTSSSYPTVADVAARAGTAGTSKPGNSYRHFLQSLPWWEVLPGELLLRQSVLTSDEYENFVLPMWRESLTTGPHDGARDAVEPFSRSLQEFGVGRSIAKIGGGRSFPLTFFARQFGADDGREPFLESWYGTHVLAPQHLSERAAFRNEFPGVRVQVVAPDNSLVEKPVSFDAVSTASLVKKFQEPFEIAVEDLEAAARKEVDRIYPLFIENLIQKARFESAAAVSLGAYLLADGDLQQRALRVPVLGEKAFYYDEEKVGSKSTRAVGVAVHGLGALATSGKQVRAGQSAVSHWTDWELFGRNKKASAVVSGAAGRRVDGRSSGSLLEEVQSGHSSASVSPLRVSSSSTQADERSDRDSTGAPCLYDALFPPSPSALDEEADYFELGEAARASPAALTSQVERAYAFSVGLYPLRQEGAVQDEDHEKALHHSFLLLKTRSSRAGDTAFYLFDSLEREFATSLLTSRPLEDLVHDGGEAPKELWSSELALRAGAALRRVSAGTVKKLLCNAALLYVDEDLPGEWMPTLKSLADFESKSVSESTASELGRRGPVSPPSSGTRDEETYDQPRESRPGWMTKEEHWKKHLAAQAQMKAELESWKEFIHAGKKAPSSAAAGREQGSGAAPDTTAATNIDRPDPESYEAQEADLFSSSSQGKPGQQQLHDMQAELRRENGPGAVDVDAEGVGAGEDDVRRARLQALEDWKALWYAEIFRGGLAEAGEEGRGSLGGVTVKKPGRGLPVLRSIYELPVVA